MYHTPISMSRAPPSAPLSCDLTVISRAPAMSHESISHTPISRESMRGLKAKRLEEDSIQEMSSTNIYVLRLEGDRYYIGKSDNIIKRYQQHLTGNGSAWTKKYKPVSLETTIENVSPFEEDKITKEYMSKYGINKVRGGSYVELELSKFHTDALKMEIWGAKDLCTQCGRKGHWIKECHYKTDVSGEKLEYEDSSVDWCCNYCDRTFTTAFGCGVHEKSCKEKSRKSSYIKQVTSKKEGACYKCGRPGHYSPDCYARTHQRGYILDSDSD